MRPQNLMPIAPTLAYYESICEKIKGADLVYHEATYLDELEKKSGKPVPFHNKTGSYDRKKIFGKKTDYRAFFFHV